MRPIFGDYGRVFWDEFDLSSFALDGVDPREKGVCLGNGGLIDYLSPDFLLRNAFCNADINLGSH
jgi:hypothetical protein